MNPNLLGGETDPMVVLGLTLAVMALLLGPAAAMVDPKAPGPRGIFAAAGMATRVYAKNFAPLTLIAALTGGASAVLSSAVGSAVHDWYMRGNPGARNPQVELLVSELPNSVIVLVWGCTVSAFVAAFSLYFWVRHEREEEGSLYAGINYALNRMGRLLPAHAKAYGLIWLGNIVVIPGIWFALQFAFVDPIATLDDREPDPLARSRRLTQGQRGKVFRTFVLFFPWIIAYQLPLRFSFQGIGVGYVFLGGAIDQVFGIILSFCFVQYYLDLFRKRG